MKIAVRMTETICESARDLAELTVVGAVGATTVLELNVAASVIKVSKSKSLVLSINIRSMANFSSKLLHFKNHI